MCEDGDQVVGVKVEEGCCMQEEEDPEPTTSAVIKTEPAICLAILRDELGA